MAASSKMAILGSDGQLNTTVVKGLPDDMFAVMYDLFAIDATIGCLMKNPLFTDIKDVLSVPLGDLASLVLSTVFDLWRAEPIALVSCMLIEISCY